MIRSSAPSTWNGRFSIADAPPQTFHPLAMRYGVKVAAQVRVHHPQSFLQPSVHFIYRLSRHHLLAEKMVRRNIGKWLKLGPTRRSGRRRRDSARARAFFPSCPLDTATWSPPSSGNLLQIDAMRTLLATYSAHSSPFVWRPLVGHTASM